MPFNMGSVGTSCSSLLGFVFDFFWHMKCFRTVRVWHSILVVHIHSPASIFVLLSEYGPNFFNVFSHIASKDPDVWNLDSIVSIVDKKSFSEALDADISDSASTCATRLACRARSSSSFVFGEFETDRRIFNSELMISVSKRTLSLRQNSRRIQQLKLKTCACNSAGPQWLHGDVSLCDDILARSFLGFD